MTQSTTGGIERPFVVTHRGVLAIAIPMTLAYLTTPLVGLVNLGVIGRLGDAALVGGVAVGALVFNVIFVTFNFLRSGTTGLVAQAFGAEDRAEIAAIFWRAILIALVAGLVVVIGAAPFLTLSLAVIGGSDAVQAATADYWFIRVLSMPFALANYVVLGWLIGLGQAGRGLLLQILLNGLNIVLSVLLVGSYGLSVAGVGWASFVAELVTALAGLVLVYRAIEQRHRPNRWTLFNREAFRRMVAVNRDIMIRSFSLLFAFGFFTAQSARAGDIVLAANEILLNVTVLGAYLLDGLAAAAEQYAGRAIGARYRAAFERALKLILLWGFGVGALVSLVLYIAGPAIIDLMTTNPEVRDAARTYLVFAALVPVAGTLAYQMDGVFIGATWSSDMRNMMLLSLVIYLAAWWVLTPILGIAGLWLALLLLLGVRGLSLLWRCYVRLPKAFPAVS